MASSSRYIDADDLINRNKRLLQLHEENKRAKEAKHIFDFLPQGPGSGLNADMVDNLHAEEIVEKARKSIVVKAGGSGRGMQQHGNEYHTPNMAEETHTHTESDITDLNHDAQKIKGKTVDDSAIGDDKIFVYKLATDNIVYEAKPTGGGGAAKCVFGHIRIILSSAYGTRYYTLNSNTILNSEAWAQTQICAGTFKKLWLYVDTNSLNGEFDIILRKNGADTTLKKTISAGATGKMAVTSDVSVVDGDLVNWKVVERATSGSISVKPSLDFEPS